MQTCRTLTEVHESSQIIVSNLPFRPGELVEVLISEERDRGLLEQELSSLFQEAQTLPQVERLTEAEIEAEITAYLRSR
ncbi:MAG: hypothetical protein HC802_16430 [Caldilineaceae bacterium]|nr:hypothetical protein [Caldilineaceae bacterium]